MTPISPSSKKLTAAQESLRLMLKAVIERAQTELGLSRRDIYETLDVKSPAMSNWTNERNHTPISMKKIRELREFIGFSDEEFCAMIYHRLVDEDGAKPELDVQALKEFIDLLTAAAERARQYDQILSIVHDELQHIPHKFVLNKKHENRIRFVLREAIKELLIND